MKPFSFCLLSKCKGIWIIYYLYKKNTVISSHWHVWAHKATTIIVDGFIFTSQRYTILIPKSSSLHWNTRSYKELWTSKKTLQQTIKFIYYIYFSQHMNVQYFNNNNNSIYYLLYFIIIFFSFVYFYYLFIYLFASE